LIEEQNRKAIEGSSEDVSGGNLMMLRSDDEGQENIMVSAPPLPNDLPAHFERP